MAGLEVVVRPVIFPDIRPRARPALPPEDDPTKGFAVIKGNPALSTSSSQSWSFSSSQSRPQETERRVDKARVYQDEGDGGGGGGGGGGINKDNFVDVDVANKVTMEEPGGGAGAAGGGGGEGGGRAGDAGPVHPDYSTGAGRDRKIYFYQPVKEAPNIEVQRKNVIQKADE